MHYKRRHPRRKVRCVHCTPNRSGNTVEPKGWNGGVRPSDRRRMQLDREDLERMRLGGAYRGE